jgi:hypothetical protein
LFIIPSALKVIRFLRESLIRIFLSVYSSKQKVYNLNTRIFTMHLTMKISFPYAGLVLIIKVKPRQWVLVRVLVILETNFLPFPTWLGGKWVTSKHSHLSQFTLWPYCTLIFKWSLWVAIILLQWLLSLAFL